MVNIIRATPVASEYVEDLPAEIAIETGATPLSIPIVIGWTPAGGRILARDLAPRRDPLDCDHAGATWSSDLDLCCPACGAQMFLPPALLKYLPGSTMTLMHELWCAAGWPAWARQAWRATGPQWQTVEHPAFAHCGGLPVRQDRVERYHDVLREMAV